MAKKVRKPRSESPRTYAQSKTPTAPAAPSSQQASSVKAATSARQGKAAAAPAAKAAAVDWQQEYSYVFKDLRRTFTLAAGLLILLIVLNFVLQVV
jgi:hypothetical protein